MSYFAFESFAPAFVFALASSLVVRASFIVPASVRRPSVNLSSPPFYTDPYSAFPCHSSTEHGSTSSHLLSSLSALGVACLVCILSASALSRAVSVSSESEIRVQWSDIGFSGSSIRYTQQWTEELTAMSVKGV
ncbi:hypothetical protein B0H13DRAFT_1197056 [Mycena leptocephala]|nr:hypothetical protein B0H13DRAFT_1197056 [Mycena leptocephala]